MHLTKQSRKDLVEKEEFELKVLQDYMPLQFTEQEVEKAIVIDAIERYRC